MCHDGKLIDLIPDLLYIRIVVYEINVYAYIIERISDGYNN